MRKLNLNRAGKYARYAYFAAASAVLLAIPCFASTGVAEIDTPINNLLTMFFGLLKVVGQHRTIAEASAVESPIRQETIGFPAHFFARAHNFKPPGRACQPEADSPMRT